MKVLVACEYSGTVRDAFIRAGHEAMSCDMLPTDKPGPHYKGDVRDVMGCHWDLMICHPPCTHLAVSGAAWFERKKASGVQDEALDFVRLLLDCKIPRICLENPISIISTRIRKPDQIIHPWQYGHPEKKATCLWLKGLPLLRPTKDVKEEMMALPKGKRERLHYLPPSVDRWKLRSVTFQGFADAMADQWGVDSGSNLA